MKIGSSSTSRYSIYKAIVTGRANRQAVNNRLNTMNILGGNVFNAKLSQTQGLNEIVAKQYAARVQAELKAKLQSTSSSISTLNSSS